MGSYVEHANLTVSDLDAMIAFVQTAVPDFKIRKRWVSGEFNWVHIGTDSSYLALMNPR